MKEGWTYKKLGEVASFSRGLTFSKGDVSTESSKKVLRSNNIDLATHSLNFDDVAYLKEDFEIPQDKMLHNNDIFICMSNGSTQHLGKVAFVENDIDYAFGGFMGAIHPKPTDIFPKFAFYYCISSEYRRSLASVLNGININNLKWSDLSQFTIPLPSISEQKRIVSELDLFSGIIEKKKSQLKEYDQLAQSIFYDMFGDPVTNEKGWEVKKLGEVCAQKTKISRASKSFSSNSLIEYIDISSIDNNSKTITTTTSCIFSAAPSRAQQAVKYGDILISLVRPNLQNIAIVLCNENNLVASSGFCVIRAEQQTIKEYLFYVVRSSQFTQFLMQRVSGANYPAVREEDVKSYTLPLPPLSLQQSFAEKIEAIEKQKELIKQSITETEVLFNSRMDYYFN